MVLVSCRLLVGVGLLLGGLGLLRRGFGSASRRHAEAILARLTRTPLAAVATGTLVTAAVQSSSAVTAMVVGLVDAGVLDLYQAFGVIMGANLGSCATTQVVATQAGAFAVPAALAGAAACVLGRRRFWRDIGLALIGVACVLTGVGEIQRATRPLADAAGALQWIVSFGRVPLLGVLAGAAFTGVVQSSGVVTATLVGLARHGLMDLRAATALALGSNIGTCATTLVVSIGASRNARTAAWLHLAFNVVGVFALLPLFGPFVRLVEVLSPPDAGRAIANAHTLFNLLSIAFVLPWSRAFVDIVRGGRSWIS